MGIVEALKEMFVPDTDPGVEHECAECGTTFGKPVDHCPNCGSTDVREAGSFEMRPDA